MKQSRADIGVNEQGERRRPLGPQLRVWDQVSAVIGRPGATPVSKASVVQFAGMSCLCALVMCFGCREQVVVGRERPLPSSSAVFRDGGTDAEENEEEEEEESEVEQNDPDQANVDVPPDDQDSAPEDFD